MLVVSYARWGVVGDFKQAAEDLYAIAGIRVSSERLRQIVKTEGRHMMEARFSGVLDPGWSGEEVDRVYVGADEVMVRGVTESEKNKRRKQHETRREQREQAGIGNTKPLPSRSCGTAEAFKEMKIGLFYDPSKVRIFTFATQENHAGFGRLLEKHASRWALEKSPTLISITDGAPWIRNRILEHLPYLDAM